MTFYCRTYEKIDIESARDVIKRKRKRDAGAKAEQEISPIFLSGKEHDLLDNDVDNDVKYPDITIEKLTP